MTTLLLWLLIIECLAILVWGLLGRDRFIQYPFLVAAVFAGWVIPQLVGLSNDSMLPEGALEKTLVMAILSLGAAYLGYRQNTHPIKSFWWRFDYNRLLIASVVLSLAGSYFFYQMSQVTLEAGKQWSGIITIYLFFSRLLTIGFVIAIVVHIRRPSWITMAIILFNSFLYLERILIAGRRAATVEFLLMLVFALWFKRQWLPPRWVVISGMIIGALVVNSMTDYRMATSKEGISETDWSDVLAINYVNNLQNLLYEGGPELRNAAYGIEATNQTLNFDYGASLWNILVHRYVPGQFVGHDLKRSLAIDIANPTKEVFGYTPHTGTTLTGLRTAFSSFWFFGAAIFALIGWIMSRWYRAAVKGNLVAQMLVMLMPSPALLAITHSHSHFFMPFVQWAAFLLPVLLIARVRKPYRQQQFVNPLCQAERGIPDVDSGNR